MTWIRMFVLFLIVFVAAGRAAGVAAQGSDLDALMSRVLATRDENWKKLRQYVLDERERVEVVGPAGARLWGDEREYTWFIREGVFVRSPVRANGVLVPEGDRRKYEDEFTARARAREKGGKPGDDGTAGPGDAPASAEALLTGTRQPQFIDSAYFLRFKFEPGRYALVGRETFEGQPVLRIEYYPARLFTHEQDDEARRRSDRRQDRDEDVEAAMERMMNKVSLVTLWVDPSANQILKYTFDNVDLDFVPGAWLVRTEKVQATMTMGRPFPGVWLPRQVDVDLQAVFAAGTIDVRYALRYHGYREASTAGRVIVGGER